MKEPEPVKAYTYELPGGWTVLAGRTDADNERLSIKLADPRDWWFHVHGMSGSHVLLKYRPEEDEEPGPATLKAAAAIAAFHSKARSGGVVPVACTRACNVSKPRGAPTGTVSIRKERILKVRPAIPGQTETQD
jgi:predicted ribosome quality control (RQC) complex YloA/Tae2 family protein